MIGTGCTAVWIIYPLVHRHQHHHQLRNNVASTETEWGSSKPEENGNLSLIWVPFPPFPISLCVPILRCGCHKRLLCSSSSQQPASHPRPSEHIIHPWESRRERRRILIRAQDMRTRFQFRNCPDSSLRRRLRYTGQQRNRDEEEDYQIKKLWP